MAHGIGGGDEGGLEELTNLGTADLDFDVLELDGAYSAFVGDDGYRVCEVASVDVVLHGVLSGNVVAIGQGHGLLDSHVGDALEVYVLDGAGTSVVTIDQVFDFGEKVILRGFDHDEAVFLGDFLLIEGQGCGLDRGGEVCAVGGGVFDGDDAAAGVVGVLGRAAGGKVEQTGEAFVHEVGEGNPLLVAEFLPDVDVKHGFFEVIQHDVGEQKAVYVDNGLADRGVIGAQNHLTGGVVMGGCLTGEIEGGAVAVIDGMDSVQVFENALASEGLHNIKFVVGDKEGFCFGGVATGGNGAVIGSKPHHIGVYYGCGY